MEEYSEKLVEILESINTSIGDKLRVEKENNVFEGLLMPRTSDTQKNYLTLKLENGYNIGLKIDKSTEIEKVEEGREPDVSRKSEKITPKEKKPEITVLGTGGTVASRVDYKTGAVKPTFSANEIYNTAPEVANIANIKAKTVCNVLSENISSDLWEKIGEKTAEEINSGSSGVVIAHGTDTMAYTGAALSFMLQNLSDPVILVGSQRSSDRPSSDAPINLASAVKAATSEIPKVCITMHGDTSDNYCLVHDAVNARKCHTSRRDAFKTINNKPIGIVKENELKLLEEFEEEKEKGKVEIKGGFEDKAALIKVHPNIKGERIERLVDEGYKGIILEGTGLGHVPNSLYNQLERAVEEGIFVGMTSQCVWGRVNMNVYSTGRELLEIGVCPLEDMLAETALVKLMWTLDKTQELEEVEDMMRKNIAGEISSRTLPDSFSNSHKYEE